MKFPLTIYIASFGGAFLACCMAVPIWCRICVRLGLVDAPGYRKIHDRTTPLAGGLAIFTGLTLPFIGLSLLPYLSFLDSAAWEKITYGLSARRWQIIGLLLGSFGMLAVGLIDDRLELKASVKFAAQLAVALLVAGCGIRITLFVPSIGFSFLLTVLWMLTLINAFNFMDNMNGLCTGLGLLGGIFFGIHAALQSHYLVAALAFCIAGALAGFLPWNFPSAKAFLGDSGSHLVGFLLAVLAILPHFYSGPNTPRWAVLAPLLVLFVPLFDLLWVVLHRWKFGKPFYIGDTNHLSHRLVRRGFTPVKAVALIWLAALLCSLLSLLVY